MSQATDVSFVLKLSQIGTKCKWDKSGTFQDMGRQNEQKIDLKKSQMKRCQIQD